MSIKKINKRQKRLLIFTTFFGLISTHFSLSTIDAFTYPMIMLTVSTLLFLLWQSESYNITAWESIGESHAHHRKVMNLLFDDIKQITDLHNTICDLKIELKKNKDMLKKTTGMNFK